MRLHNMVDLLYHLARLRYAHLPNPIKLFVSRERMEVFSGMRIVHKLHHPQRKWMQMRSKIRGNVNQP